MPRISREFRPRSSDGGNPDATARAFPDLNHPFQHCKTGHVDEYAQIDETISVEILEVITEWIAARFLVR